MPKHKALTDAVLKRIKPPKQGSVDHFDQTYPGLHARVSHTGRKVWGYYTRYRGKQIRLVFDPYPCMSVAEAHDKWRLARDAVAAGKHPRQSAMPPAATDVEGVVREWLQRDQAKNRSKNIVAQSFEREILPHWRHLQITDIGRRECLDRIDRLVDQNKVIAARRMHAKLHRFFQWCVGRGIVTVNPLAAVDKPGEETKRDRVLDDGELARVWGAAEQLGFPYGSAFQLLILTGGRREEIGQIKWSEIVDGQIELSGDRTKNGEPHIIPLSVPARAILETLPRIGDSEFVFTVGGKTPISGWARAKADLDDRAQIAPWRTHDIRRTVATGLQKQGVALQVTESVLGHVSGSRGGIVGVYQKYDYAAEKRAALEAWGAHVVAVVEGREPGKVVAIGGR